MKFFIASFVLFAILHNSLGLECYSCDTEESCNMPLDNHTLVTCAADETHCLRKYFQGGISQRSCGKNDFVPGSNRVVLNNCSIKYDDGQNNRETICFCQEDRCNSYFKCWDCIKCTKDRRNWQMKNCTTHHKKGHRKVTEKEFACITEVSGSGGSRWRNRGCEDVLEVWTKSNGVSGDMLRTAGMKCDNEKKRCACMGNGCNHQTAFDSQLQLYEKSTALKITPSILSLLIVLALLGLCQNYKNYKLQ